MTKVKQTESNILAWGAEELQKLTEAYKKECPSPDPNLSKAFDKSIQRLRLQKQSGKQYKK